MGTLSIRSIGQRLILHILENGEDADLGPYSTLKIIFTKPDGTEVEKDANLLTPPGLDGRLYVEIEAGFLSVGRWTARAVLTVDAGHVYYADSVAFAPGS